MPTNRTASQGVERLTWCLYGACVLPWHECSAVCYVRTCSFGCSNGVSKSDNVLLNGIKAVMVLTLILLKYRAPYVPLPPTGRTFKPASNLVMEVLVRDGTRRCPYGL